MRTKLNNKGAPDNICVPRPCSLTMHADGSLNCDSWAITHRTTLGEYRCDFHGYLPEERAVNILIKSSFGDILGVYRNDESPTNLGFPAGKVENTDVSDWHAASRELKEETGLEVDVSLLTPVVTLWCRPPPSKPNIKPRLSTLFVAHYEVSATDEIQFYENYRKKSVKKDTPVFVPPYALVDKACDFWEYNKYVFRALGIRI